MRNFEDKKARIAYIDTYVSVGNNIIDIIKNFYNTIFNVVRVEKAGTNIIYKIPSKISNKNKIITKIEKLVKIDGIDAVVLSNLVKNMDFKFEKLRILNKKFLMKNLIMDVMENMCKFGGTIIQSEKVYVLVDNYNKQNLDILRDLADNTKSLNIITSKIKNFKNFEDQIYQNNGIMITVSNNKRKSLKNAEIIINFDFSEDIIKKYVINRQAIIINISNNNIEVDMGFNGIKINDIEIDKNLEIFDYFKIYNIFENFDQTELYESLIFNKPYDKVKKQKKKDGIIIKNFIGVRGKIEEKEFEKLNSNK